MKKKMKAWLAACCLPALLGACASDTSRVPPLPVIHPSAAVAPLWQVPVGASGEDVLTPAVVGSSVYAASAQALYKIDAASGRILFGTNTGHLLSGGVGAGQGLVAVGTSDGLVLAYNTQGQPAWHQDLHSAIVGAPAVGSGQVIVRTLDGRIVALNASTGQPQWTYQHQQPALVVRSNAGPVLAGGAVFVGLPAGRLVALNAADGTLGWDSVVSYPHGVTDIERVNDVVSPPLVVGAGVCAVSFQGRIGCFDGHNGNLIWSKDLSSTAGLASDGHNLFATDTQGHVYAFDLATGAQFWRQDGLAGRQLSAPQVTGRHIVIGDRQGLVHVQSADDGSLQNRMATDGSAILAQPQSSGNTALVQTRNGRLLALSVR